jgi:NTE family protein
MRIGLALSGGGIRALVFHLGILARLAADNKLEEIRFISTVSGGSLCAALVFSAVDYRWPSSAEFQAEVVPYLRNLLTTVDLQRQLLWKTVLSPRYLFQRSANALAELLEQVWRITGRLPDLPDQPRWIINATCHETGKRWRFEKKRMGDYVFGQVEYPDIAISQAVAASSAVPFAIGPLTLSTRPYEWCRYGNNQTLVPAKPAQKHVHLWDGALYDNLGVEALVKMGEQYRDDEINFLIVSDASPSLSPQVYWPWQNRIRRLYDMTSNQSQASKTREVMSRLKRRDPPGGYFKIGRSATYILEKSGRGAEIAQVKSGMLADTDINWARDMELSLKRLSSFEFDCLFHHGFEVANFTLYAYNSDEFSLLTI